MGRIRNVWKQLRFWVSDWRASRGGRRIPVDDSLARTIKESTHVRGAYGGMARSSTEQQHKIVAEGHENYTKSFDKRDR